MSPQLAMGIQQAVKKGVLPPNPPVEPTVNVDVLGKSVDEVCKVITTALGDAPSSGCILVLQGLSGTGKGTTVASMRES